MNWSNITIDKFQQLATIRAAHFDYEVERELAVISCITGISTDDLETFPKSKIMELSRGISFINTPVPDKLKSGCFVMGSWYDIETKANNINAEQFILLNKFTTSEAETVANLHNIMATLTYKRKYVFGKREPFSKDFEAKAEAFKNHMSIEIANGAAVFFCNLYKGLLSSSEIYLMQQAKILKEKAAKMM